jgi:tetratricopeptide (TPR) repeat protein
MKAVAPLLLVLATALIHWPFGVAELSFDDREFVQVNASIRTIPDALGAMFSPFPPDQPERALYRPLTNLSYAVDFALSGTDARVYHRTNVLLYLVLVGLVYRFASVLLGRPGMALAAALVFSLHPVHTGAVDAVAGRSELLALVFGVASILFYLRAVRAEERAAGWLAGALVAYALACLSKETGAVVPGVLAFLVLLFHPPRDAAGRTRRDRALRFLVPFAGVLVAYVVLRYAVLGRFSPEQIVLAGQPLGVRLLTMGAVFFEYLRLLVFPRVLQVDFYYHDTLGIPTEPSVQIALGLIGLAVAAGTLAVWVLQRLRVPAASEEDSATAGSAPAIISLAIFLIFFFPISHVLNIGALMAERFLLAPSLGFVLLVTLAADAGLRRAIAEPRHRRICATVLVVAVCLLGAARSVSRAAEWRDHVRLWQVTVNAIPWDTRARLNLAGAYLDRGNVDAAQAALVQVLETDPRNIGALGNLGAVQLQRGDFESARETCRRLLEVEPQNFIAWNNLGIAEASLSRHSIAVAHYRRALGLNPNYIPAQENLRESERQISAASRFLETAGGDAAASRDPVLLRNFSAACTVIGDAECARRFAALAARVEER